MRVQFKGMDDFKFPKNYNDYLSYNLLYKVKSLFKDSSFENFDLFSYSTFNIVDGVVFDDYITSKEGIVEITISSCDELFLRQLLAFFALGEPLIFKDNKLFLYNFQFLDNPDFSEDMCFTTSSAIFLNDYNPDLDLSEYLSDILVEKYKNFNNVDECRLSVKFLYDDLIKSNFTNSADVFHGYWCMMDFRIIGDCELINFAWDVGVGFNNCQGFGMLETVLDE